jgi:hypothetical protein
MRFLPILLTLLTFAACNRTAPPATTPSTTTRAPEPAKPRYNLLTLNPKPPLHFTATDKTVAIDGTPTDLPLPYHGPRMIQVYNAAPDLFVLIPDGGQCFLWDNSTKTLSPNLKAYIAPIGPTHHVLLQHAPPKSADKTKFLDIDPATRQPRTLLTLEPNTPAVPLGISQDCLYFYSMEPVKKANIILEVHPDLTLSQYPIDPQGFSIYGRHDSIRDSRVLLTKLAPDTPRIPPDNYNTPPRYEVAIIDFKSNTLRRLATVDGIWDGSTSMVHPKLNLQWATPNQSAASHFSGFLIPPTYIREDTEEILPPKPYPLLRRPQRATSPKP